MKKLWPLGLIALTIQWLSPTVGHAQNCQHVVFATSALIRSDIAYKQPINPGGGGRVTEATGVTSSRAGASTICQQLAEASPLLDASAGFRALLSLDSRRRIHADDAGTSLDARDYATISGPVCNMNGEVIADTEIEFWSDRHTAAMNLDENGATTVTNVWTGNDHLGRYARNCSGRSTCNCRNWTSTKKKSHGGHHGNPICFGNGGSSWATYKHRKPRAHPSLAGCFTGGKKHNSPCSSYKHIYCISEMPNFTTPRSAPTFGVLGTTARLSETARVVP